VAEVHRREGEKPSFSLGYGACFGHNEIKAISNAVLDRTLRAVTPIAPAEDQEFVLMHSDGVESAGFCSHFKLPH
jgi:alpha-D-ribose 1-methylphosphonate 5-triphosphate synthase subunit PhnI